MFLWVRSAYYYVPAIFANMAPVIVSGILRKTVTNHQKYFMPIWETGLGANKTWLGFASAIIFTVPFVMIQKDLMNNPFFEHLSLINYSERSVVIYSIMMGSGAMIGDILGSLYKRSRKVPPGERYPFVDSSDFIIGVGLVMTIYGAGPGGWEIFWAAIAAFLLHSSFCHIGYYLGLKKVPY